MNSIKREETTSFGAAGRDGSTRPDVSEVRLLLCSSLLEQHSNGVLPWDPARGQVVENSSYSSFPSVVQNIFGDIMRTSAGIEYHDSA